MIISTNVLDRAAFLTLFGGKLLRIEGHYPENQFVIEVNRFVAFYETIGGWVPYRKFGNERRILKRKSRKHSGLPEYFTGNRDSHFELNDLAHVVGWKRGQAPKLPKTALKSP